jgi:8-amino-7-oxononanoate synthase
MDIFAKTQALQIIDLLKKVKLYPFFRKIESTRGSNVVFGGKELVMMGSNNYLGLTHDPRVIEASVEATKKWGTGCTGSRFLNGNLELHEELERQLAEFLGFESVLVFASGFMANQGAIGALAGPGDFILSDEENHACIIEGCKLSGAKIVVYKHLDADDLEQKTKALPADSGKLIVTDGVFSMTGHLAPFDKIHMVAKKYGARTYVDDAHGLGVIGEGGKGTLSHFGLQSDVLMGTFSKSLASQGGFIASSKDINEWLRHKARTFMFSAGLSPASSAAALKALEILKSEPDRVKKQQDNATYLNVKLSEVGLNTMGTETSVIPVFIGDDQTALLACKLLLDMGVFTTPVVYPAVPRGQAVIRCSVMSTHTKEDLDKAIFAFSKVAPIIVEANQRLNEDSFYDVLNLPPDKMMAAMKEKIGQISL